MIKIENIEKKKFLYKNKKNKKIFYDGYGKK
jgi:hypothetical protein